jgi:hypothetical protein
VPLSLEQAREEVTWFVDDYNQVRPHSALGHITPEDYLEGRAKAIFDERDSEFGSRPSQCKSYYLEPPPSPIPCNAEWNIVAINS